MVPRQIIISGKAESLEPHSHRKSLALLLPNSIRPRPTPLIAMAVIKHDSSSFMSGLPGNLISDAYCGSNVIRFGEIPMCRAAGVGFGGAAAEAREGRGMSGRAFGEPASQKK